jgi:hypothetical protein
MTPADALIAALRGVRAPRAVNGVDSMAPAVPAPDDRPRAVLPRALAAWEATRPQREADALLAATTPTAETMAALTRAAGRPWHAPAGAHSPGPEPDPPAKE